MKETTDKNCANCKFFYRHYGLHKGKLHEINCGHCLKSSMRQNTFKFSPTKSVCNLWEENFSTNSDKQEDMFNCLQNIKNLLDEYYLLLKK